MQGVNETAGGPVGGIFLLFKAIGGGVICLLGMWIGILVTHVWRMKSALTKQGATGLTATAGGWTFLLQSPVVVILLAIGFGIGFYAAIRWSLR